MLLSAKDLAKSFHLRELFSGVSLTIDRGDRIGLIGPNGAGKSTLLKILASQETPDSGLVRLDKGAGVIYVAQREGFDLDHSAHQIAVLAARECPDHHGLSPEVIAETSLTRVGFDEDRWGNPARALSGGWRKRLAVAEGLARCGNEPDLLLLDEPTNHLDFEGIAWLEKFLTAKPAGTQPFASIFVTHDRSFLESVATRVIELSAAYPDGTLSVDGNYSEFLRRKQDFLEGQAHTERVLANQNKKDLAWLARGPQGRQTKQKGRIQSSMARMDELAEIRARNTAAEQGGARVEFGGTDRKTRKLIQAIQVAKAYPGQPLFSALSLTLGVGDCLGLLGPNGSGKSTLIGVLTGSIAPDHGEVKLSEPPPRVSLFSQHREDFPPTTTLREALCPISDEIRYRGKPMHVTAWARRFLFRDEQLASPISALSGGELARVHIARIMLEPADVLILDEPTNDLDIPTLELLEQSLEDFPGALVLVTHDRAMLERLATSVIALDGKGAAQPFASVEQAVRAQIQAAQPTRSEKPKPPAQDTGAPVAPKPSKKKLSYKEQREFDGMEDAVLAAEAQVEDAQAIVDHTAGAADHKALQRACEALEVAQARVAELYKRWEELEAKVS